MVLDDIEDVADWEPQRGEVLFCSEASERINREIWEHLLLEGGLPPILVASIGQSLALRVHLFSIVVEFKRVVD